MEGPSHARIGAAVGAVTAHALGAETGFAVPLRVLHLPSPVEAVAAMAGMVAVCGSIGAIAALLPDLDTESTLGAILPRWWHALTPGHRGVSHSLLAAAAWWWSLAVACASLGITGRAAVLLPALVVAGVVSHLLADALTDHGIRPFSPFSAWHLRSLAPFRTGAWPERWVVVAVCGLAVVLLVEPIHLVTLAERVMRGGG